MIRKSLWLTTLVLAGTVHAETPTDAQRLLATPLSALESTGGRAESGGVPPVDCLLAPSIDADIASPVVGVIRSIDVEKGQRVRRGDVLFRLRSEVEQATLKLNQAQTDYGRRTIDRNNDLYRQKLISEQERDEIVINNRLYEYEMAQTQAMLAQKTIRSPFSGLVVDSFLDPGEYVGEDPVVQVAQLDPLYVEAVVPGEYFGRIVSGDVASVTLAAPLNSVHQAKVTLVDRVLDAASGTFGVRLTLANPDYRLPAGLKCRVRFGSE